MRDDTAPPGPEDDGVTPWRQPPATELAPDEQAAPDAHLDAQEQLVRERAQFAQALAGRDVIGQAKGLLMERYGLSAAPAFAVLVRSSRTTNRPLRAVAVELVTTRRLPGAERDVSTRAPVASHPPTSASSDSDDGAGAGTEGTGDRGSGDRGFGEQGADGLGASEGSRWADGPPGPKPARAQLVRPSGSTGGAGVADGADVGRGVRERAVTGAALVGVAQALGGTETEAEVLEVVTGCGADLLGATGGVLALWAPEDVGRTGPRAPLRVVVTDFLPADVAVEVAQLAPNAPLPMVQVAGSGRALYLSDRAAALGLFPDAGHLYERAEVGAAASLPLRAGSRLLGSLSLAWPGARDFTADDEELLASFAALCAQALDRVQARAAERAASRSVVGLAETLQRSALARPAQPDHLDIAVRYLPANEAIQIGGDFHDAFSTPGGDGTYVVIGDVNGHDQAAAALMTQIRSLLRATAYAIPATAPGAGPAAVLAQLETTMTGLQVQALTSAVVATVSHAPVHPTTDVVEAAAAPSLAAFGAAAAAPETRRADMTARPGAAPPAARDVPVTGGDGVRPGPGHRVVWCNAGHLPPVVRRVGGRVEELGAEADLLLGVGGPVVRAEHRTWLEETETLLLYTDGLVERRGEDIDTGLERLRGLLADHGDLPPEQLADVLLHHLVPDGGEDDVALLVLRVRPTTAD